MNGPAGRVVVAEAEVPVKLRLGYRFATAADEARYEEARRPAGSAPASGGTPGPSGNVSADGGQAVGPDSPALEASRIDPARADLEEFEDLEDEEA